MKEKIDLFADYEEEAEVVVEKVTTKANPSTPVRVPQYLTRTQEDYETYIVGHYYEDHENVKGEIRNVKVTVLKDEINPMELLKPAYAYGNQFN